MLKSAVRPNDAALRSFSPVFICAVQRWWNIPQQACAGALCSRLFVPEPECVTSQWLAVPGRHLDMLARRRLLKKSVDAPEVNENIWFLPDLFTSQLGHMSWQVTRVHRPQRWPIFPPRRPRNTAEKAPVHISD